MATRRRRPSKQARSAGYRRALKFAGFNVLGFVLVNATAIAAAFLVGMHFGNEIATALSLLVGAVAAGIQKSISWVDTGFDPNTPTQTMPNPLGGGQP